MSSITEFLQQRLILLVGWTLIHFVWQGALIGAAAGILMVAFRQYSSQTRYVTLMLILLIAAVCPLCTFKVLESKNVSSIVQKNGIQNTESKTPQTISSSEIRLLSERTSRFTPSESHTATSAASKSIEIANHGVAHEATFEEKPLIYQALPWIVSVWCVGVIALTLRMAGGCWKAHSLVVTQTKPLPNVWQPIIQRLMDSMNVRTKVQYLESALTRTPLTIGWLKPVILVPGTVLTGLSQDEVECLLAHELAHIRRHDYLLNVIQNIVEILLFYHPVIWWLSRSIRQEREECCDALAIQVTGHRAIYSRALLSVAVLVNRPSSIALASDGGYLKKRVQRIAGIPVIPVKTSVAVILLIAAIVLGSLVYLAEVSFNQNHDATNVQRSALASSTGQVSFIEGKYRALPIEGQVVDLRDRPLPGAQVYLREATQGFTSNRVPVATRDLALITTDSNGRFRFDNVPIDKERPLYDVAAKIDGYAIGWEHIPGGLLQQDVRIVLEPATQFSGQILDDVGSPLAGATVQLNYLMSVRHIAQADLEEGRWPRSDDEQFVYLNGFRGAPLAMTDAAGRFTLKGLPTGLGAGLQIRHRNFAITNAYAATVNELDPENVAKAKRTVAIGALRVNLKRARLLKVQVVYDDTNTPVGGARYPDILNRVASPPTFEADRSGEFEITHLDRRELSVHVFPPLGSDYLVTSAWVMFDEDEYEKTCVIRLKRGAVITGRVVDEQTGQGISGVSVWAGGVVVGASSKTDQYSFPDHPFKSQADGKFKAVVNPGNVTLDIRRRITGTAAYSNSEGNSNNQHLPIAAKLDAPVEDVIIKAHHNPTIRGTVSAPDGTPAPGVSITGQMAMESSGNGIPYQSLNTLTDERGNFEINQAPRDSFLSALPQSLELTFLDRHHNLGKLVAVTLPKGLGGPDQFLAVRLEPLGSVSGRFINTDTGQPIPNVRVALYKQDTGPVTNIYHTVGPEIRTGQNGRFKLHGAFGGAEQLLSVTDGRFQPFHSPDGMFKGSYGEEQNLGDLKLVPKNRTPPATPPKPKLILQKTNWQVRVRVVDSNGMPIPNPQVGVQLRADEDPTWQSGDREGENVVTAWTQTPNYFYLRARADGYAPSNAFWRNSDVNPSDPLPEEFTFSMTKAITVGGVVVDEEGHPVQGASVSFSAGEGENRPNPGRRAHVGISGELLTTDEQGCWRCNLAPETLTDASINVYHSDYVATSSRVSHSVPVADIRALEHKWTLKKGFAITGRVVDTEGIPIEGAALALGELNVSSPDGPFPRTDSDGRYRFERVSPKYENLNDRISFTIAIMKAGYMPILESVPGYGKRPMNSSTQQERIVNFELRRGVTHTIHVVDTQNQPVVGVRVILNYWNDTATLRGIQANGAPTETDQNGNWQWTDAPPGESMSIDIWKSGYSDVRQHVVHFKETASEETIVLKQPQIITGTVVDAVTKRPIPEFNVERAFEEVGGHPDGLWWTNETRGRNGVYQQSVTLRPSNGRYTYRVQAEGYKTVTSKSIPYTEGETKVLNFELHRK